MENYLFVTYRKIARSRCNKSLDIPASQWLTDGVWARAIRVPIRILPFVSIYVSWQGCKQGVTSYTGRHGMTIQILASMDLADLQITERICKGKWSCSWNTGQLDRKWIGSKEEVTWSAERFRAAQLRPPWSSAKGKVRIEQRDSFNSKTVSQTH